MNALLAYQSHTGADKEVCEQFWGGLYSSGEKLDTVQVCVRAVMEWWRIELGYLYA